VSEILSTKILVRLEHGVHVITTCRLKTERVPLPEFLVSAFWL
jgi:hypothetical protein